MTEQLKAWTRRAVRSLRCQSATTAVNKFDHVNTT